MQYKTYGASFLLCFGFRGNHNRRTTIEPGPEMGYLPEISSTVPTAVSPFRHYREKGNTEESLFSRTPSLLVLRI